ncbi:MAG: HlyD family efflux transporter periplasmic adaptor subunit [Planctomycetota bacterium]|jgi:multidrug resistance efflux pump
MKKPHLGTRLIVTGVVLAVAVTAGALLYLRLARSPWTRDGQVQANVVLITPRVQGVVVQVAVTDNQSVRKDDLLFEIDPSDYALEVASARVQLEQTRQQVAALEAAVLAAQAGVEEADAGVTTAQSQIESARAQVSASEGKVAGAEASLRSAQAAIDRDAAALAEAIRDRDRAQRLAADGAGSVAAAESRAAAVEEKQATLAGTRADEQAAQASADQARASLEQAQAGLATAEAGLGEAQARLASARAALIQAEANLGVPGEENVQIRAAKVDLQLTELSLAWTTVRAPADGYITNRNVDVGDFASPGTPLLAFVDSASFHVHGYFRETQLRNIEPGDRALVTLMSHRGQPIEGVVESIGWAINPPGIATTEGSNGLVPQVEPSFDWIRLAQRVPVRIRIVEVPEGVQLISGTTASVAIRPGSRGSS